MDNIQIAGFDLETTGLEDNDRIVEICVTVKEYTPAGVFVRNTEKLHTLINPGMTIPQEVIDIHGITNDMVKDAPKFSAIADEVQKLIKEKILLAHNTQFDVPFLHKELQLAGKAGIPMEQTVIDTLKNERYILPHKLEACYGRYTGKQLDDAHRADADVDAMYEVLEGQLREHGEAFPEGIKSMMPKEMAELTETDYVEYLDHSHKFYRDASGIICFGFGKHRDEPCYSQLSYVNWMAGKDFPMDTMAVVDDLLVQYSKSKP